MNQAINTEIIEPSNAIALRDKGEALAKTERKSPTAQELRIVEVNEALLPAYQKASTLELSDSEIAELTAPFPDEIVEIRPHDGLIYLPHIHISSRLNKVLKPGKWSLVCRRHWLEGNTMYGEYVLVIRGCYVGESVGGHPYQPNNPKVNYSDTLESTAAEALRRIAGKRLSCGSQVWEPEYARQWVAKYAGQANGKWFKKTNQEPKTPVAPKFTSKPSAQAEPIKTPHIASQEAKRPLVATPEQKAKLISTIEAEGPDAVQKALGYFIEAGAILPIGEHLKDLPLNWIPTTAGQFRELGLLIAKLNDTGVLEKPAWYKLAPILSARPETNPAAAFNTEEQEQEDNPFNEPETKAPQQNKVKQPEFTDETWRSFVVPFGKNAGKTLDKLPKNTLFGFWANFEVETEYNGKAKKPETIAKDRAFRAALDQAGIHYSFEEPTD